jgi:hypothetical protein
MLGLGLLLLLASGLFFSLRKRECGGRVTGNIEPIVDDAWLPLSSASGAHTRACFKWKRQWFVHPNYTQCYRSNLRTTHTENTSRFVTEPNETGQISTTQNKWLRGAPFKGCFSCSSCGRLQKIKFDAATTVFSAQTLVVLHVQPPKPMAVPHRALSVGCSLEIQAQTNSQTQLAIDVAQRATANKLSPWDNQTNSPLGTTCHGSSV